MVIRVDRNGEALIWCRKFSGYARHNMSPKLINRYTPEKMDTKEYGNMLKLILTPEGERGPSPRMREDEKSKGKKCHQEHVQKASGTV